MAHVGYSMYLGTKGQLISKCLFSVFNFFQKMNENKSTLGIIVVKSNLFVRFLEEIDDSKKPFRNELTFRNKLKTSWGTN